MWSRDSNSRRVWTMNMKEKICINFSKDFLFRKVENLPVWGANARPQEATKQEKGRWTPWELTQGLNFIHRCVIYSSFLQGFLWHVLEKCFETSLRWSVHILPFPCAYSIPTETCTSLPVSNRSALSALWVSPGCEQTPPRKDISQLLVPKPLSFIQSQHIV